MKTMKMMKTISGKVSSVFPELNCFEINSDIFFHDVKASIVKKLRLGKKITVQCRIKKIKSGDWTFTDFIFLKIINKKPINNKQNNNGKEKRKCRKCMGKGNCERNI